MVLTVGDMFAGIGGVALAFEQAGFSVSWANEFDKMACKTYKANFDHRIFTEDICSLDSSVFPKVDVITSGNPCQSFSLAGNKLGLNDPRGNLFFEAFRIIDTVKPKAFLFENVKNLKSHDKGNTLRIIKKTVEEDLNYSFIPFTLSACRHGNIPQARERVYIVGFRNDIATKITKSKNYFIKPEGTPLTKTIEDLLYKEKVPDKYYFKEDHKYIPKLKEVMKSKKTVYQWRRVYVRENKNNLCPTLTANMGSGGHNVPLVVDDFGFRKLTPRECFRFQGFPETFVFPQDLADSHLYKQAGNSVTVPVVTRLAKEISRVLLTIS